MNVLKLKAKMVETNQTIESVASALNIAYNTARKKVNGKSKFNIDEINGLVKLMKLDSDSLVSIFFGNDIA